MLSKHMVTLDTAGPISAGGIIECARGGKEGEENGEGSERNGGRRGGRRKRKERLRILYSMKLHRIRLPLVVLCIASLVTLHLLLLTQPLVLIVNFVVVS